MRNEIETSIKKSLTFIRGIWKKITQYLKGGNYTNLSSVQPLAYVTFHNTSITVLFIVN